VLLNATFVSLNGVEARVGADYTLDHTIAAVTAWGQLADLQLLSLVSGLTHVRPHLFGAAAAGVTWACEVARVPLGLAFGSDRLVGGDVRFARDTLLAGQAWGAWNAAVTATFEGVFGTWVPAAPLAGAAECLVLLQSALVRAAWELVISLVTNGLGATAGPWPPPFRNNTGCYDGPPPASKTVSPRRARW
jgi:hypothetical protein